MTRQRLLILLPISISFIIFISLCVLAKTSNTALTRNSQTCILSLLLEEIEINLSTLTTLYVDLAFLAFGLLKSIIVFVCWVFYCERTQNIFTCFFKLNMVRLNVFFPLFFVQLFSFGIRKHICMPELNATPLWYIILSWCQIWLNDIFLSNCKTLFIIDIVFISLFCFSFSLSFPAFGIR